MVRLAEFSAHSCVALELWLEVHHCTAVWLMAEGRRRKTKDKGKEVEKQSDQPCRPWDLPWPATATPPLEEKSAQPGYLQPPPSSFTSGPCLYPEIFFELTSPILPLIPDLNWKTKKGIYQGAIRSLCLCSALSQWSPVPPPHQWQSGRLHGVNMWALQVLKYQPPPW